MAALQDPKPENLPGSIRHYINGEWVDSVDGDTFEVLNPVTNKPYIKAASGKKADIEAAVAAAKKAFDEGPWPKMLPRERSRVLHKIADIVESRGGQLAAMESYDSGLPITQALGQARRAAENFRFFADLIVAQIDDAYKVPGRQVNYVNRKPIGVAGLITPWNTPFMLESWKLGPALATGNTVVLKPAEFTPLSASLWPGIFEEAGVPAGVFSLNGERCTATRGSRTPAWPRPCSTTPRTVWRGWPTSSPRTTTPCPPGASCWPVPSPSPCGSTPGTPCTPITEIWGPSHVGSSERSDPRVPRGGRSQPARCAAEPQGPLPARL